MKDGLTVGKPAGQKIEIDAGRALDPVQAVIAECDGLGVALHALLAAPCPRNSADLEQIRKIRREAEGEKTALRLGPEIMHRDAFMAGAVPKEFGTAHMQGFARQHDLAVLINVGIGEIDGENDIVILHRRGQQQRPLAVDQKLDAGKMPCVVIEKAARRGAGIDDVAQGVEQREGVALFEGARPAFLNRLGSLDVKRRKLVGSLCVIREGLCLHFIIHSINIRRRRRIFQCPPTGHKSSDMPWPWRGR